MVCLWICAESVLRCFLQYAKSAAIFAKCTAFGKRKSAAIRDRALSGIAAQTDGLAWRTCAVLISAAAARLLHSFDLYRCRNNNDNN